MKKKRSNYKHNRKTDSTRKFFTKEDVFISRMASILLLPKRDVRSIFSQRTVTTIRLNNLAAEPTRIKRMLEKKELELKHVPWAKHTYIVTNMDKSELGKMREYERGLFYIQNLSSILSSVILDPQKGEKILDLCAAPGSKTTHISSMVEGDAQITANEEDFRRMKQLQKVLNQFHSKDVDIRNSDGRNLGTAMPGHFDKVLVDVPCSGEGLVYLNGEKPLRYWNLKKVKVMSKLQKELILSAFDSLRTGGKMVYSTCTLEPEENEEVVEYLIKERKDAHIERIELVHKPEFEEYKHLIKSGITKWSGLKFHQEVGKAIRILPSAQMQGFFICLISKKK